MNKELQQLFNNLIQVEHVSTTLYLAMSSYMGRLNYTGIAHWLRLQSDEERTHMLTLIDYVVDRDGTVQISELPAQSTNFGTPLEMFRSVLEHEQRVTNSYRQAYNYAIQMDPQAAVIIQDFLREQISEEAQVKTIVDRLQLAEGNSAALFSIRPRVREKNSSSSNTTTSGIISCI